MAVNSRLIAGSLGLSILLAPLGPVPATAQNSDAKALFQEAVTLKTAGNLDKAVLVFREAVAKDRSILSENDQGLIESLRSFYEKKIKANANDPGGLEGMAFVAANCDGDFPNALQLYTKALAVAPDDQAKTPINAAIQELQPRVGGSAASTGKSGSSSSGNAGTVTGNGTSTDPEVDRIKKEAETAQAEADAKREAQLQDLNRSKEEMESRLPKIEEEIKSLEEENERNHRMYYSTNDRRYKRKEDSGEQAIEAKKKELDRIRNEIDQTDKKIDRLNSGSGSSGRSNAGSNGSGEGE